MSCRCREPLDQISIAGVNAIADEFKRRYCISGKIERQIVAMSENVPPHPDEQPKDWLERLYRAWYAANQ
jgi:hypothetical protein